MSERQELQLLGNVFMCLHVALAVAVCVMGNRNQAVIFIASLIPWAIGKFYPEFFGANIIITAYDSDGNVVKDRSSDLIDRIFPKIKKYIMSFIYFALSVAALLSAGTDKKLAFVMIAGHMTCEMADNCESRLQWLEMDEFFGDFEK